MTISLPTSPSETESAQSAPSLTRTDLLLAAAVGFAVFLLYWRTLAFGLLIDDSGEFQTMTRLLGHTHPTGYEVYTLFGRVFASIPIGDFATRVSAFSAFTGGLTAALFLLTARLIRTPKVIAAVAAAAFAVIPTVWSQAIIAEVYLPGAALMAGIFVSLLLWESTSNRVWLAFAGVLGGLGLGVHFTMGLLLPGIAIYILLVVHGRGEGIVSSATVRSTWLPALSGAVIGISVTLIAFVLIDLVNPTAEYFNAVVAPSHSAWDLTEGQINSVWERVRFDWTARQFSSLMFTQEGLMGERFIDFRSFLPTQIALPLLLVGLIGVVAVIRRHLAAAVLILVSLAVQIIFAFNYDIGDQIYVFYIPTYFLIVLLAAAGLTGIANMGARLPRVSAPVASTIVGIIAFIVGVIPLAAQNTTYVAHGTPPPYEFDSYPYDDYVATTLHPVLSAMVTDLPMDAIVFGEWDTLYPNYWVAHVEQGREDLLFHETYPADDQDGVADSLITYILTQAPVQPVFVADQIEELTDRGVSYSPVRLGPTKMWRVVP